MLRVKEVHYQEHNYLALSTSVTRRGASSGMYTCIVLQIIVHSVVVHSFVHSFVCSTMFHYLNYTPFVAALFTSNIHVCVS